MPTQLLLQVPFEIAPLDSNNELLATLTEPHIDPGVGRNHYSLLGTAANLFLVNFDMSLSANRDLQEKEIPKGLGPNPDTRTVSVIYERDSPELHAPYAHVQYLFAADDIEFVRYE